MIRAVVALLLVAAPVAWASADAAACWGRGVTDVGQCKAAMAPVRSGLGLISDDAVARWWSGAAPACGAAAPCVPGAVSAAVATGSTLAAPPSDAETPGDTAAVVVDAGVSSATPAPNSTTAATSVVASAAQNSAPTPEPKAANCGGAGVDALAEKASLSPGEVQCLADLASGRVSAPDSDVQTAAIALYNRRSAGWQDAVEKALGRPGLKNAAALNQAGIAPAYNGQRFEAVLTRSRAVWSNLDKGYQVDAKARSFVAEHACRSAVQLQKSGKSVGDGLTWCERWLDLATKVGAGADDARAHVAELE